MAAWTGKVKDGIRRMEQIVSSCFVLPKRWPRIAHTGQEVFDTFLTLYFYIMNFTETAS